MPAHRSFSIIACGPISGRGFLINGDKPFDDEAIYTAILLHDLGLTDLHRLKGEKEQCFTIVGARMASKLAHEHQWTDKRANLAANAITLHLNATVEDRHGREAQLVRIGSGAAGLGLDVLYPSQIKEVCTKYSRLNLKREILPILSIEAQERPCSRIALLRNKLGFEGLIKNASMFTE